VLVRIGDAAMSETLAVVVLIMSVVLLSLSMKLKAERDEMRLQMVQAGCMVYDVKTGKMEVKK
jgi:hypothetical protein